MLRTFIAVELPERLVPEIEKIESVLKTPGIKLVEPKYVHITMKFLGDITEEHVEPIAVALSQLNCKPFEARIKGVGVFPKLSYIRVIWLGAEGNFEELHDEIERVLAPFRFEKDHRFSPHATLARVKELREKATLLEKINSLKDIEPGMINVESITLKKSTLRPEGPVYENLRVIKLQ